MPKMTKFNGAMVKVFDIHCNVLTLFDLLLTFIFFHYSINFLNLPFIFFNFYLY